MGLEHALHLAGEDLVDRGIVLAQRPQFPSTAARDTIRDDSEVKADMRIHSAKYVLQQ